MKKKSQQKNSRRKRWGHLMPLVFSGYKETHFLELWLSVAMCHPHSLSQILALSFTAPKAIQCSYWKSWFPKGPNNGPLFFFFSISNLCKRWLKHGGGQALKIPLCPGNTLIRIPEVTVCTEELVQNLFKIHWEAVLNTWARREKLKHVAVLPTTTNSSKHVIHE